MKKTLVGAFAFVLAAWSAGLAAPQAASQAEKLPTGDAVLAKYVEASGGLAAFQALKTRIVNATMEIPSASVVLTLTIYAAAPDRMYTIAESDATGTIESGSFDGVAWETSANRGAVVKAGGERDDALRDAIFDRLARWKEYAKSAECIGSGMIDGKPVYKVRITPKIGSPQTVSFDQGTGLIAQSESQVESPAGKLTLITKPSDYRKVDGVTLAFTNRVTIVEIGQDRIVTVNKIDHTTPIPASRFTLPAEIKALVDAKK